MIIQLENTIQSAEIQRIEQQISSLDYKINHVKTQFGRYLVAVGSQDFDIREIGQLKASGIFISFLMPTNWYQKNGE